MGSSTTTVAQIGKRTLKPKAILSISARCFVPGTGVTISTSPSIARGSSLLTASPDVVIAIATGEFDFEAEEPAQGIGLQDLFLASVSHDPAV